MHLAPSHGLEAKEVRAELQDLILPKLETEVQARNYGQFSIGPLHKGYGITLGNALRRVLISSLPGAAITSIRINGVHHDFSPIPGAREDTTQFILNVKQIRLISHSDEPVRLFLSANGTRELKAGDIEMPSQVEIVNPDVHLLSLDEDEARIEVEFVVQRGRGYSPSEEREKLPIGEIPVDAIFSPVRKVNYSIEPARVEQRTDFDRLIVEVWTDGTMSPADALREAGQVLVRHFQLVASMGAAAEAEQAEGEAAIPAKVYDIPIEDLDLSARAHNCLRRAGITKVGEILERLQKGEQEVLVIRNFGRKSLDELYEKLAEKGLMEYTPQGQEPEGEREVA